MSQSIIVTEEWLKRIGEQVIGVEYGVIQITIHDSQIVQIDRTERKRFDVDKSTSIANKRK